MQYEAHLAYNGCVAFGRGFSDGDAVRDAIAKSDTIDRPEEAKLHVYHVGLGDRLSLSYSTTVAKYWVATN